jgi:hypothetical protein
LVAFSIFIEREPSLWGTGSAFAEDDLEPDIRGIA